MGCARIGSGRRAGGVDRTSGVDTAGTVAKIDLRLLYLPGCEATSADPSTSARSALFLSLRSLSGGPAAPARSISLPDRWRLSAAFVRATISARCERCARCNGSPAREQEPCRGAEPWRQRGVRLACPSTDAGSPVHPPCSCAGAAAAPRIAVPIHWYLLTPPCNACSPAVCRRGSGEAFRACPPRHARQHTPLQCRGPFVQC